MNQGKTSCPSLYKQDSQLISKGKKTTNPYKIVIPAKVEKIIRYFCAQSPLNEWSGVLFYKVEGDFDSNLKVICEDIFLMDVGNGTYTEYKFSNADIASYLVDNPELLDCYQGLIHSHDTMSTFFSGTDSKTLQAEGNDTPIFVSLIVNNAGSYTAGITRKVKFKNTVTREGEYQFFQETKQAPTETLHSESTELEWFDLDIIKEEYSQQDPLAARFCSVVQAKARASAKAKTATSFSSRIPFSNSTTGYREQLLFPKEELEAIRKPKQTPIGAYGDYVPTWEDTKASGEEEGLLRDPEDDWGKFQGYSEEMPDGIDDPAKIELDPENLKNYVAQLVTGSPIISPAKIDLTKWVQSMDEIYGKRFDDSLDSFETWMTDYVNFLSQDFEDDALANVSEDLDPASVFAYHAEKMLHELNNQCEEQTGERSVYVDNICNILLECCYY